MRKRYKNDFKLEVDIEAFKEKSTLISWDSKYEAHEGLHQNNSSPI